MGSTLGISTYLIIKLPSEEMKSWDNLPKVVPEAQVCLTHPLSKPKIMRSPTIVCDGGKAEVLERCSIPQLYRLGLLSVTPQQLSTTT